jgi:hypothetical protein
VSWRFEADTQAHGLVEAARRALPRFAASWEVRGADLLPQAGPLLVVSNHPGTIDAMVITAGLPRSDLKMVARDMRCLRILPTVDAHMIYATTDTHVRMVVLRGVVRQLQQGGAVLLFPTGKLDPDPAVLPGASQALDEWSSSLDLILRRVPEAQVAPAIVSGILSSRLFNLPWLRNSAIPRERQVRLELLQITLQSLLPRQFAVRPAVVFGAPMSAMELLHTSATQSPRDALVQYAQTLLREHFPQA